jgi:tRNA-Thr(GGU) m(6)t(6)A37 methyltransferase TsaA
MLDKKEARPGEVAIELPRDFDAGVYFIGRIRTPFASLAACPKNIGERASLGKIELDPRYAAGLEGLSSFSHLYLLYWLDQARRDLVQQVPAHLGNPHGTFALRSPVRPNPIGLAAVELVGVEAGALVVRSVDCVDGTPLLDIKPYYAAIDSIPAAKRP